MYPNETRPQGHRNVRGFDPIDSNKGVNPIFFLASAERVQTGLQIQKSH
jgi:hypothetical protein